MRASRLVDALKRLLKARGIHYAELAVALGLSEAGVKRMFSRGDFTLQRLEDVCRIARVDLDELARAASAASDGIERLDVEQERELVSNPTLMLVALCAVGNWTLEQILDTYDITRAEGLRCLARLDRYRIIELTPENRIRPLISRTFSWLPDGPIQRYFRASVEAEYLGSKFDRPEELFLFVSGMLSRRSAAELIARLREVAREFAALHRQDVMLALPDRHGTSLLLATRAWEPREFRRLRRADRPPSPAGGVLHPPFVPSLPAKRRRAGRARA